jgi:hypothetical protein
MQPYPKRRVFFVNHVTLFIELFAEIGHVDSQRTQRLTNGWSWFRASRRNAQIDVTNKRHAFRAFRDSYVVVSSLETASVPLLAAVAEQSKRLAFSSMTSHGIMTDNKRQISKFKIEPARPTTS